jgi:CPA2 family monovalent cation:H+ antiporter-2
MVVIESEADVARAAGNDGFTVVSGNAADVHVLREAGIENADRLIIAIPEGYEAGAIAQAARRLNPGVTIFARAHSDEEVAHLERLGVDHVVMGEREIAKSLIKLLSPEEPLPH